MTDDPDVEARRRYDAFHRRSLENPDAFWRQAAQLIDWSTSPDRVSDDVAFILATSGTTAKPKLAQAPPSTYIRWASGAR